MSDTFGDFMISQAVERGQEIERWRSEAQATRSEVKRLRDALQDCADRIAILAAHNAPPAIAEPCLVAALAVLATVTIQTEDRT